MNAKTVYITLWVFWIMFCVRFSYKIGLIGTPDELSRLTTAAFLRFSA
jgi:hypothetical protein